MDVVPNIVHETREQRPAVVKVKAPYPIADKKYHLETERLKAKMLGERLLHKKWDRTGELHWRFMQRLGDFGRKYFFDPRAWPVGRFW